MSFPWRQRTPSPMLRTGSSSVRSTSFERSRPDEVLGTRSISGTARSIEYDGDRRVWTAEADGRVLVRGVLRGEVIMEVPGREASFCTALKCVSAKCMWAAFTDGFIRCYDIMTGGMMSEFVQHDGTVNCLATLTGNDHVYSGGNDWKVYQWSKSSCTYLRLFSGHSNGVRCILVHGDGGVKPASEDTQQKGDGDGGNDDNVNGISSAAGAVESAEEFVFSGSDDCTIKVWDTRVPPYDAKCEACVATLSGHRGSVLAMAMHPPCGELWSGSEDCSVRVWEWRLHQEAQKCVTVLKGRHSAPVTALVYIAPRMWSSGKDGTVVVWDGRDKVPLHQFKVCGHPINTMQLLCRAVHHVVWLGGHESPINVLHTLGDGPGVEAKLYRKERRCRKDKGNFVQLQCEAWNHPKKMGELHKRNKMMEEQLQVRNLRLGGATRVGGGAVVNQYRVIQAKPKAEPNALKASRARLEMHEKAKTNVIAKADYANKQKDEIIQLLRRSLAEKDAMLQRMEANLRALKVQQEKLSGSKSVGLEKKKHLLEEAHGSVSRSSSARDAYKEERDALRRQLLEAQNYKVLWEAKDDALREANEQMQEMQRNLENEQQYVNELLQELSRPSRNEAMLTADKSSTENNSPSCAIISPRNSTHHYLKRLAGIRWADVCAVYLKIVHSTLVEEIDRMVEKEDVIVRNVAYAPVGDFLLVDVTLEHPHSAKDRLQSIIDSYPFPKTVALHSGLSSQALQERQNADAVKAGECEAAVAAREEADAERKDALQRLRHIEEELEAVYDHKRQAEARRARIVGLPSMVRSPEKNSEKTRSTSPRSTKPPLYAVTAEEYEAAVAAREEADAKCKDALQKLRNVEEEFASLEKRCMGSGVRSASGVSVGKEDETSETRRSGLESIRPPLWGSTRRSPQHAPEHAVVTDGESAARSASEKGSMQRWCRCQYPLGDGWAPLVNRYQQLVEDVFVMEVCRALCIPLDHVRCVRFLRGSSAVEVEVRQTTQCEDPSKILQRHSFSVLAALLGLSRLNSSPARPVSAAAAAAVSSSSATCHAMRRNDEGMWMQQRVPMQSSMAMQQRNQRQAHFSNDDLLMKELELFRSRRLLAKNMRNSERTLQQSSIVPSSADVMPVELNVLLREPIYCVTLDEYCSLLRQFSNAAGSHKYNDDEGGEEEEEEEEDPTRLWNGHVLAQAEEERQFTCELSRRSSYC